MTRTTIGGAVLALFLAAGCYASDGRETEPLECPPAPCVLFHADEPYPRGRVFACDACASTEAAYQGRAGELGCAPAFPRELCTDSGACDYAALVRQSDAIEAAETCDELAAAAFVDPCVRPDPSHYWTANGSCEADP